MGAAELPQSGTTWLIADGKKRVPVRVIRCTTVGAEARVEYEHLLPYKGKQALSSLDLRTWRALAAKGLIQQYP